MVGVAHAIGEQAAAQALQDRVVPGQGSPQSEATCGKHSTARLGNMIPKYAVWKISQEVSPKGAGWAGRVGRAWRCILQLRMSDGLLLAVGSCDDQDPGLHAAQDCLPHLPASPATQTWRCSCSADAHTAGAELDPAPRSLLSHAIWRDDAGSTEIICASRSKDLVQI